MITQAEKREYEFTTTTITGIFIMGHAAAQCAEPLAE